MSTVPPPPDPNNQQPPYQQPAQGYTQQAPPLPAYRQPMAQGPYNLLAIIGFVASFFIALAGIVLGHIALGQIKRTGERGHGLALAATILGYVFLALQILSIIAVVIFSVAGLAGAALIGAGTGQTVAQACSQYSKGLTDIQSNLASGAAELGSDPQDAGDLISKAADELNELGTKIANPKISNLVEVAGADAQILGASAEAGGDVTSDASRFQDSLNKLSQACR